MLGFKNFDRYAVAAIRDFNNAGLDPSAWTDKQASAFAALCTRFGIYDESGGTDENDNRREYLAPQAPLDFETLADNLDPKLSAADLNDLTRFSAAMNRFAEDGAIRSREARLCTRASEMIKPYLEKNNVHTPDDLNTDFSDKTNQSSSDAFEPPDDADDTEHSEAADNPYDIINLDEIKVHLATAYGETSLTTPDHHDDRRDEHLVPHEAVHVIQQR